MELSVASSRPFLKVARLSHKHRESYYLNLANTKCIYLLLPLVKGFIPGVHVCRG